VNELTTRIVSGVVMIAIALMAAIVGGYYFAVMVAALATGMFYEWMRITRGWGFGWSVAGFVYCLLPALALPTAAASFSYIAAFGVGTVAAMTAFAGAIGGLDARGFALSHHRLMAGTGVVAIAVGCVWIAGAAS